MNKYYVYKHIRLDNNSVFYVGKGKANRAYLSKSRNTYWHNIVNKVGYKIEIIKDNLSETDAFSLEKELIMKYKKQNQCEANLNDGGLGSSGYKWTDDQKEKLSKLNSKENNPFYNKKHSEKAKLKMSKNGKNKGSKKVICLNNGIIYNSTVEAGEALNLYSDKIACVCRGVRKTTGGFKFKYYKD